MANKKTRKKWTSNEERILSNCVKHCLTLYDAFEMAAEKTGRTHKGIEQHYYKNKHILLLNDKSMDEKKATKASGFIAFMKNLFKF